MRHVKSVSRPETSGKDTHLQTLAPREDERLVRELLDSAGIAPRKRRGPSEALQTTSPRVAKC